MVRKNHYARPKIKAIIVLAVFVVFFALGAALQCNRKEVKSLEEDVKDTEELLLLAFYHFIL